VITARGFADDGTGFEDITREVADALTQALDAGSGDTHELQQIMRRHLGRWVSKRYRRRPMIVPTVIAT
jgi:ribonuclease J